jgi:hypothetical protein
MSLLPLRVYLFHCLFMSLLTSAAQSDSLDNVTPVSVDARDTFFPSPVSALSRSMEDVLAHVPSDILTAQRGSRKSLVRALTHRTPPSLCCCVSTVITVIIGCLHYVCVSSLSKCGMRLQ